MNRPSENATGAGSAAASLSAAAPTPASGNHSAFLKMLFPKSTPPTVAATVAAGGGGGSAATIAAAGGGGAAAPLNKAGAVKRLKEVKMLEDSVKSYKAMATHQIAMIKTMETSGASAQSIESMRQATRELVAKIKTKQSQIKILEEEVRTRYRPSRHRRSKKRATRRKHRN